MIGALVGMKEVPDHMLKTLLNFDCEQNYNPFDDSGIKRPAFLNVSKHAIPLIKRLIEIRPKDKLVLD